MSQDQQPVPSAASTSGNVHLQSAKRNRAIRNFKDKLATYSISVGGLAVLGAILLIFFYLLYEIAPLFKGASIDKVGEYSLVSDSPIEFLAIEEQAEVGLAVDQGGEAVFFDIASGNTLKTERLHEEHARNISAFAIESEESGLFAVAYESGEVVIGEQRYKSIFPDGKRQIVPNIEYPFGREAIQLTNESIAQLALRDGDTGLTLIALTESGQLIGMLFEKEEDFLSGETTLSETRLNLPAPSIAIAYVLVDVDQRWLTVASKDGQYQVIDIKKGVVVDSGQLLDKGELTSLRFLLGGISLASGSSLGEVSQWFMTNSAEGGWRLNRVRSFEKAQHSIDIVLPEHRRKGFVTLDEGGELNIYHSTSQRHLLNEKLIDSPIISAALSPRANHLIVIDQRNIVHQYVLNNKHPEVSFHSLWEKVWYESYNEPEYLWQSSASNNDFEPKYSFSPLAFGTLKAAFYAMLFAAPLAVCGAIYTAYFMAPALRRKVKPLIELMEALPTVILGFLAGLWLAPFVEKNLPGVFSVLVVLPVSIVLFAYLWGKLPKPIRQKVPDGWHVAVIIPVVVVVTWACFALSAPIELLLFDGNTQLWMKESLGISFDQRNALIVGIAMGFAVVPTIFSIAEDAIFSVPKQLSWGSLALGSTPWQTLVGVVIPTASPGIFSGLMIGLGRAVGETMIVLMATGNTPVIDANIFEGMRTLAANIAVEIGETEVASSHYRILFLAALVLFMFTFVVNTAAEIVRHRLRKRYGSL